MKHSFSGAKDNSARSEIAIERVYRTYIPLRAYPWSIPFAGCRNSVPVEIAIQLIDYEDKEARKFIGFVNLSARPPERTEFPSRKKKHRDIYESRNP